MSRLGWVQRAFMAGTMVTLRKPFTAPVYTVLTGTANPSGDPDGSWLMGATSPQATGAKFRTPDGRRFLRPWVTGPEGVQEAWEALQVAGLVTDGSHLRAFKPGRRSAPYSRVMGEYAAHPRNHEEMADFAALGPTTVTTVEALAGALFHALGVNRRPGYLWKSSPQGIFWSPDWWPWNQWPPPVTPDQLLHPAHQPYWDLLRLGVVATLESQGKGEAYTVTILYPSGQWITRVPPAGSPEGGFPPIGPKVA